MLMIPHFLMMMFQAQACIFSSIIDHRSNHKLFSEHKISTRVRRERQTDDQLHSHETDITREEPSLVHYQQFNNLRINSEIGGEILSQQRKHSSVSHRGSE